MEPTLRSGDRLLVRHGAEPRPGRVCVVRLSDGVLGIKRVSHLEPEGWWVERDNPREGIDSWAMGAVAPDDVVAVAVLRVWPRPGRLHRRG